MKKRQFFLISCLILGTIVFGCEKSADQTQSKITNSNLPLILREDYVCDDCPVGCCCCGNELQNGATADVSICGLCVGDYLCQTYTPGSPCSSFAGFGRTFPFTAAYYRDVFCVEPGASFVITNLSGSPITVRFTCDTNSTPPTYLTAMIQPGKQAFYHNDGSCIVAGPC